MSAPTITRPARKLRTRRIAVRRHIDPNRGQPIGVPVLVRWPIDLRDVIRAELTGRLPLPVAKLIEQARAQGYAAGRWETLDLVAANIGELDILGAGWRERAVDAAGQQRRRLRAAAEERALFANRARNIAAARHPDWVYRGQAAGGSGAVDWETGYPVETVEAWKRRQALTLIEGGGAA